MKPRLVFSGLLLLALSLAVVPTAMASSTWYADGVSGSDNNDCKSRQHACKTIGHAISLASSGDTIMVAAATYTENLTIAINLEVIGARPSTTIIDGGGVNTVVGIPNSGTHVALSRVTIRNGLTQSDGGGIHNGGTLTIKDSTLSGNSATRFGGNADGGGISNSGTLTISNSTISRNSATSRHGRGQGGGIYNSGKLTINNSTVSGNSAGSAFYLSDGGGIYNFGGTLTIRNVTFSGNTAGSQGGGVANSGTAMLQNAVVANSPSGGNCAGTMTSKGYNLSSDNTCNFNGTGDLNNTDPKLGQLGNYGGPTPTIPLLSGSPAIDAGNPSGCTDSRGHLLKTDQRGKPRPDKEDTGGCDMGAYERQKD